LVRGLAPRNQESLGGISWRGPNCWPGNCRSNSIVDYTDVIIEESDRMRNLWVDSNARPLPAAQSAALNIHADYRTRVQPDRGKKTQAN